MTPTPTTPTRRQERYAKLVRGWSWRTEAARLKRAEILRGILNLSQTELIERAIDELVQKHAIAIIAHEAFK
jgi:hypothetical protein